MWSRLVNPRLEHKKKKKMKKQINQVFKDVKNSNKTLKKSSFQTNKMDSKNLFKFSTKSSLFLLRFFFLFISEFLNKSKERYRYLHFFSSFILKTKFQLNIPRRVFLRLLFLARSVRHSVNCYRSYKKRLLQASLVIKSKNNSN